MHFKAPVLMHDVGIRYITLQSRTPIRIYLRMHLKLLNLNGWN